MISLKGIRLGRKLQLAFLLMVGFTAVVGVKSAFDRSRMSAITDDLASRALGRVHTVASIGSEITESRAAALEVLTGLQLNHEDVAEAAKKRLAAIDVRLASHTREYLTLLS